MGTQKRKVVKKRVLKKKKTNAAGKSKVKKATTTTKRKEKKLKKSANQKTGKKVISKPQLIQLLKMNCCFQGSSLKKHVFLELLEKPTLSRKEIILRVRGSKCLKREVEDITNWKALFTEIINSFDN